MNHGLDILVIGDGHSTDSLASQMIQRLSEETNVRRITCMRLTSEWKNVENVLSDYQRVIYFGREPNETDAGDSDLRARLLNPLVLAVLCREKNIHFTYIYFHNDVDTLSPLTTQLLLRLQNALLLRYDPADAQWFEYTLPLAIDTLQKGYDGEFTMFPLEGRLQAVYPGKV